MDSMIDTEAKTRVVKTVVGVTAAGLMLALGFVLFSSVSKVTPIREAPARPLSALNQEMRAKLELFATSTPTAKLSLTSELKNIAASRFTKLQESLRQNPSQFAAHILPAGLRAVAPQEVAEYLEETKELRGKLVSIHSDSLKGESNDSYEFTGADGKTLIAYFADSPPTTPEAEIQGQAVQLGDELFITAYTVQSSQAPTAPSTATSITYKMAVILFKFSDTPVAQPLISHDVARGMVFTDANSANAFYAENTHDQVSLTGLNRSDGDVFGWYTIDVPHLPCNLTSFKEKIDALASADGVNLAAYDRVLYNSAVATCGKWGYTSGVSPMWVFGTFHPWVVSHELGHTFSGAAEAGLLECRDANNNRVAMGVSCTTVQYGDPFDVMGGYATAFYHLSSRKKVISGFIPSTQVQEITTNGDYVLVPQQPTGSGMKELRIARGYQNNQLSDYYSLEYRRPYGLWDTFNVNDPVVNGVSIRLASRLVDTTPATATFQDAPLLSAQTLTDDIRGVTIQTVASTPTSATVRVQFSCVRSKPNLLLGSCGSVGPKTPGAVHACTDVTIENTDSVGCPDTDFVLTPTLPASPTGWIQNPAPLTKRLRPGEKATVTFDLTSPSSVPTGFYTITETVTHPDLPAQPATGSISYHIDAVPPVVSITQPANDALLSLGTKVNVTAQGSDNYLLRNVKILLDNTQVKECVFFQTTAASCVYPWILSGVTSGTHTLKAIATDTANATSEHTISVRVRSNSSGGPGPIRLPTD